MRTINDEEVEDLIETRTFKTATHKVANSLHIDDSDAMNLVYSYLIKRLKNKDWNLKEKIKENDSTLNWLITWSSRDAISKTYKTEYKQSSLKEALTKSAEDSYLINLEKPISDMDDDELEKIIKLLPKLFKQQQTVDFIAYVLKNGQSRAEEHFNLTKKQFKKKIEYIERFCKLNREEMISLVIGREDTKYIAEKQMLKKFIDVLENQRVKNVEEELQKLLDDNFIYYDDLIGDIPNLINPVVLLKNFEYANNKDKYKLVNKVYEQYEYVSSKLIETVK